MYLELLLKWQYILIHLSKVGVKVNMTPIEWKGTVKLRIRSQYRIGTYIFSRCTKLKILGFTTGSCKVSGHPHLSGLKWFRYSQQGNRSWRAEQRQAYY